MVWHFIGVYIINRILHGRLEIRNFLLVLKKIFHSFAALKREIFFNTRREIFYPARPCNTLYVQVSISVARFISKEQQFEPPSFHSS